MPDKTTANSTPAIRKAAFRGALAVGITAGGISEFFDPRPLTHVGIESAVAALGALATWWVYHWASRRNDGLVFLMGPYYGLANSHADLELSRSVGRLLFVIAIQMLIAFLFGRAMRPRTSMTKGVAAADSGPGPASPDAILDPYFHAPG